MGLIWREALPPAGQPGPQATVPPGSLVYAIGDVHGQDDLLAEIHTGLLADADARRAGRRVLIYLGDYLSRGRDSRAVVERVLDWHPPGWEVVYLMGNHEDLLLRFLAGDQRPGRHWLDYGGVSAMANYGLALSDPLARDAATLEAARQALRRELPPRHRHFLETLRLSHREGGYFFVHAGVLPGLPLERQLRRDLVWIRNRFRDSRVDHGAVVVHGHCITPEPEVRANRIGIDTGAYRSNVLTCLALEGKTRRFLQTGGGMPSLLASAGA